MKRTLVVLFVILLVGITHIMADQNLLDVGKSLDNRKAVAKANTTLSLDKTASGPVLRVVTSHPADYPGVNLFPAQDTWDLTAFEYVDVDIANVDAGPVYLRGKLFSPAKKEGQFESVGDGLALEAGQAGTLRIYLPRAKPAWAKVDLFGMRGYPWGIPLPDYKPTEGFVEHVAFAQVSAPFADAQHVFQVRALRAGGKFVEPTDLLKDPDRFFPCIDTFGQYIHADWPGKTHSPADLPAARQAEEKDLSAHPAPANWDSYGGCKDGPTLPAKGCFYVAKHEGRWWLVDPEGRLFFSQGMDCVTPAEGQTRLADRERWFKDLPAEDSEFKDCYRDSRGALMGYYKDKPSKCFDFGRANLMRKYGADWSKAFGEISHRRLRSWGINTIANWSSPEIYLQHRTPYTANVSFRCKQLAGSEGYWGKFHDVFDPDFAAQVAAAMAKQADTTATDPWCIGYFVDNEISWGDDDTELAVATLASPADQAAKKAFLADLQARYGTIEKLNAAWGTTHASWDALASAVKPPDVKKAHDDLAAFHAKTAEVYFRTIRDAVKAVAPNHLYLGCRFAWANRPAVLAATKYCDVVSFNIYQRDLAAFEYADVADVPMIIGEFHFGALDRGLFHPGLVRVEDQAHRAAAYQQYVHSVLADPHFVGCHWFKYMDEPTTGRPMDEENYQIGFLDIVDTPYAETIQACRDLAKSLYTYRMNGK